MKTTQSSMWKWCAGLSLALGLFIAAPQAAVGQGEANATASPVTQDFNSIGASATASLPTGFKMTATGGGDTATWTNTANLTATTAAASNGSPSAGARYNWGATGGTDRAIGFMTSGSFAGPNAIIAGFTNNTGSTITQIVANMVLENYRINSVPITNVIYYSTDGKTWGSHLYSNVMASGTSAYGYPRATNVASFTVASQSIAVGGKFYFLVNCRQPGSNGQGVGLDDVSLTLQYASSVSAPSVTTVAADTIATTTAKGNGNVTSDGGATVTERGVCYKTSSGVTITDNKTAAVAGGTGTYSVDLSSLSVNQIYYFKAYAINSVDTTLAANELNFTTLAIVPAAPTVANPTSSSLDITVNDGGNPSSVEFAIQRTNDNYYLQADGTFGASAVWATKSTWGTKTATGLSASTTYYIRVKARNSASVETAFGSEASGTTSAAATGIWINPLSAGTPMGTYYLGDTMGEWYVNFEIGQTSWNDARVGIGTSVAGTGYDFGTANWYEDGEGSNKRVRRNLSGYQYVATGSHYVVCQAKANSGDEFTSKSGNGWGNSQAYPPADLSSAYFTANAINDPSSQSVTVNSSYPSTRLDLSWSKNAQSHNVMVVRKLTSGSWTEPTQGTAYAANAALGDGVVVYNGSATSATATGLVASTTYDFKFYSVNANYYSAGVTDQEATEACARSAPTGVLASETNTTDFTAAWDAVSGATGYRLDVSTNATFGGAGASIATNIVRFDFNAPTVNALVPNVVASVVTSSVISLSSGAIETNITTGTYFPNEPYVEETGGWAQTSQGAAKYFTFTIYPIDGNSLTVTGITFRAYATSAGPSAFSYDIDGGAATYTVNAPDSSVVLVEQPVSGVADKTGAIVVKIQGWHNSSRTTAGSGAFRLDDVQISGTVAGANEPSFVVGYSNLAVSGTSQLVTGLTQNTDYYFRLRSEGEGGCPSVNSATGTVKTIAASGGPQTIDFPAIGDQVTTNAVVLSATASSGLTVSFAVGSGPASISDSTNLTFTGAGEVKIVASQAGGGGWDPADDVTNTFNVTKAVASVTLNDLAQAYDGTERVVTATTVPASLTVDLTYDGNAWAPTNPGTYEVIGLVNDTMYQGGKTNDLVVSVANPASFTATAAGVSAIDLAFAANGSGNDVVIVRNLTGTFDAPSGTPPAAGNAFAGGTVVYVGTSSPQTDSSLSTCTPYFYKAWSHIDGWYSTGLTDNETTATPAAPAGVLASETNETDFTAAWDAATGASGYRLDVSTNATFGGTAGGLFISEVADPSDNANARFVELYNASGDAIDLSAANWYLSRQANGGSWADIALTGTIPAGGTYVVAGSLSVFTNVYYPETADQYSTSVNGNGNDGYFLYSGGNHTGGTLIDAYGVVDQDGTNPVTRAWAYTDKRAERNSAIALPNDTWTESEWTISSAAVADMTPGDHTCTGAGTPSFVPGFENLAVAGTSQSVTGLTAETAYYFRVRAEGAGGCTSANSATGTVTTLTSIQNQTITDFLPADSSAFLTTDEVGLSATASSGLPVSFAVFSGNATITGDTNLTFTGDGEVKVVASQAGNGSYNPAPEVTNTYTVTKAPSTIEATGSILYTYTGSPQGPDTADVTGSSGAVTYEYSGTGDTTYGPSATKPTDAGNYQVVASVAADAMYASAVSDPLAFDIGKAGVTVTPVTGQSKVYGAMDPDGYAYVLDPIVAVTGELGRDAGEAVGFYDYTLGTLDAGGNYELSLAGTAQFEITPAPVTVTPTALQTKVYGAADPTFTYVLDPVVSVTGDLGRDAGEAVGFYDYTLGTLDAGGNYQLFLAGLAQFEITKATATVELLNLTGHVYDGTPKAALATTDPEGLTVLLTYDGSATAPSNAGSYAVTGTIDDVTYEGSATGTLVIDKADQTIDFPAIADKYTTDTVILSATASSGLAVSYDVAGPATLVGTTLTFTGPGEVSVTAKQAGDLNWNAAADVVNTFDVTLPPAGAQLSASSVNVREAGEGRFYVRLDNPPLANLVVSVDFSSGDASLVVQSGASLTFKPSNWSTWQAVTLAQAADDGNVANETATFKITTPGAPDQFVTATALDDDIAENVALASSRSTISVVNGGRPAELIDGIHANSANYGTLRFPPAPVGTMTLDLKAATALSRVRLLNWDWDARYTQYKIEWSTDNLNWTMLADATTGEHRGWEDWAASGVSARYLKITGQSNSVNPTLCIAEWEVYGTRTLPDLPQVQLLASTVNVREGGEGRFYARLDRAPLDNLTVNVSRTSGDASLAVQGSAALAFTPGNWAIWKQVTLGAGQDMDALNGTATFQLAGTFVVSAELTAVALDDDIGGGNVALASAGTTIAARNGGRPADLIDGIHANSANYGTLRFPPAAVGTMTLDLKAQTALSQVRVLNWDWDTRHHQYKIEWSTDNVNWTMLADATTGEHRGWEDWAATGVTARYLKLTAQFNSANPTLCIAEWEVYSAGAGRRSLNLAKAGSIALESEPIAVLTSDGPADQSGWNAVDGDSATAWVGQKAGGGYLVIEYRPALALSALEVELADGSLAGMEALYSQDGVEWLPLPEDAAAQPVSLNFLWLVFPDDGTVAVPNVLEIVPNP